MPLSFRDYLNNHFLHKTSTGMNNIPYLDGVRGVAILMVITCHFFALSATSGSGFPLYATIFGIQTDLQGYLMSGSSGVRLFFVLSAFLLFMPYAKASQYGGKPVSASAFYKRRALRIVPAFFLAMAVYAVLLLIFGVKGTPGSLTRLNFVLNLLFINPLFVPVKGVAADYIPGTWSLVTEVHFYLLLSVIGPYIKNLKRAFIFALAMLATSYVYRAAINGMGLPPGPTFTLVHNLLAHIDIFSLGMLASFIYVKGYGKKSPIWLPYLFLAAGCLLYYRYFDGELRFYELMVGLSFFFIVLGFVIGPSPFRSLMEWTPLRFIGLVSYSMFLFNSIFVLYLMAPVQDMFSITTPAHKFAFNMTIGLALFITLSAFSYLYIEKPFLSGRKREKIRVETGADTEQAVQAIVPVE